MINIKVLEQQALEAIENAADLDNLGAIRIEYLGKKGKLTSLLKQLGTLSPEERPKFGAIINQTKDLVTASIETKHQQFTAFLLKQKLASEKIDVTLAGRNNNSGSLHPISQVKAIMIDYFTKVGFDTIFGPEIEEDYYNFEALNIPGYHPARAMHDTFYFNDCQLLRTHTSPVQIRFMEQSKPPISVIAPGRVYRCDSDLTHTPMFHQIEGLCIDKGITLAHLKGLLESFFNYFFQKSLKVRFRPSYFPFTEPSAEVDIECVQCSNQGCRLCKFTGWLEVLGCGMVHPAVLKAVNIFPKNYQGWAFGMGIDRLTMLYFGIDDLRMMFENDRNFLQQF